MNIQGKGNQVTFVFPDREVSCKETTDAKIGRMLERADISVIGNNNIVCDCVSIRKQARRSC